MEAPKREFTPREREVIHHAATGKGTKEIAAALNISPNTAAVHLREVYSALGISGSGAGRRLALWAAQNGFGQNGETR
ncbi:MAG: Bacterial regulatory protein luxR family [Thermomicrobiales bacterium]|nr:Bacterial regulatory protein luxR family [Thermomicrobiales bacterium]